MTRRKRTSARIAGAALATQACRAAGGQLRQSRRRRRLTQEALGQRIGVSRSLIGAIEAGAPGAPLEVWFALGEALGRPFRAEFGRDTFDRPADGAHLDIQELVLRLGRKCGYEGRFEVPTRPSDPARSRDAPLLDRRSRRLLLVECWNTFGDLGAAMRSSDRKLVEAAGLATSLAADGPDWTIGLCWVVRDTVANRTLIARYVHIFASRFPGSSVGWVRALTTGGPPPAAPGLVWCDLRATSLFARRQARCRA